MHPDIDCGTTRSPKKPRRGGHDRVRTFFNTECSICGRQLRVLVEQLGQLVACAHCGCEFVATDPAPAD